MIAYQLLQVIRTRLRHGGENASWTALRRILEGQQRTATSRITTIAHSPSLQQSLADDPHSGDYGAWLRVQIGHAAADGSGDPPAAFIGQKRMCRRAYTAWL